MPKSEIKKDLRQALKLITLYVIASEAWQSICKLVKMDCRVAKAPRNDVTSRKLN